MDREDVPAGHGVYALACDNADASRESLANFLPARAIPLALESQRLVYVGESRHLQRRVREHVDGEWGGKFTSAHPPVELLEYESVDSGDETDEKGFAETFHDPPQTFVYSDVMEY